MTSKRWLRTFGVRTAKIVFALSLLWSCISFGQGDPNMQLRMLQEQSTVQQWHTLDGWAARGQLTPDVTQKLSTVDKVVAQWTATGRPIPIKWLAHQLSDIRDMLAQERASENVGNAVLLARKIKSSPIYRDSGIKDQSSWLTNAVNRLQNLQMDPKCNHNNQAGPAVNMPHIGSWFTGVVWAILVGLLLAFIAFAASRMS